MPDASRAEVHAHALVAREHGWRARLDLRFDRDGGRTRLAHRAHEGPLVVQKPLYPEGESVCQCIVVHPPGGIAGGDELSIEVDAGALTAVQLTTPGAAKWYRAAGRKARQNIRLQAGDGALVEWLPQATIVFDGVDGASTTRVELAANSVYIGWDVVCLGRTASAEQFGNGMWRQRIEIVRDGALVWSERVALRGGDALLASRVGLNGAPVFGTFVAMAAPLPDDLLAACRRETPARGEGVVTRLPHALVGRFRGDAADSAHEYFRALWAIVRPRIAGRSAVPARIWST
jgi:urease accessory protein